MDQQHGFRADDQRYKLIFFYGVTPEGEETTPAAWELYDLEQDPTEMRNEYENPLYAKVVAELKAELQLQRSQLNETDQDYPKVQAIIDAHWN
ncbi:MAG: sulfatase/phosphatase domain-containing protein [Planctomycetota bacterium]